MTITTWNPSDKNSRITLSNGNLTAHSDGSAIHAMVRGTTSHNAGKWYWEISWSGLGASSSTCVSINGLQDSVLTTADGNYVGSADNGTGFGYSTGAGNTYASTWTAVNFPTGIANAVHGVAVDLTAGKFWFTDGTGAYLASGNPATGANPATTENSLGTALFPAASFFGSSSGTITLNTGNSPFSYPLPAGFQPWDPPPWLPALFL